MSRDFTTEQAEAGRAKANTVLKHLLDEAELDVELRDWLYHQGITNVRRLCGLEETRTQVREVLRRDFCLDPEKNGIADGNAVSDILAAWGDARKGAAEQGIGSTC